MNDRAEKTLTIELTQRQMSTLLGGLSTLSEMGDGDISHEGRELVDEICRQVGIDGPRLRAGSRKDLRKPRWKR